MEQTLAAVSVCAPGMTSAVGLHGVLQLNICRVTSCSGRRATSSPAAQRGFQVPGMIAWHVCMVAGRHPPLACQQQLSLINPPTTAAIDSQ